MCVVVFTGTTLLHFGHISGTDIRSEMVANDARRGVLWEISHSQAGLHIWPRSTIPPRSEVALRPFFNWIMIIALASVGEHREVTFEKD